MHPITMHCPIVIHCTNAHLDCAKCISELSDQDRITLCRPPAQHARAVFTQLFLQYENLTYKAIRASASKIFKHTLSQDEVEVHNSRHSSTSN